MKIIINIKDDFKLKIDYLFTNRIQKIPEDQKKSLQEAKEIEVNF